MQPAIRCISRRRTACASATDALSLKSKLAANTKTTSSAWTTIPRSYLRQVWWQQYVLGAERTLVVWEQHRDFVPVGREPQCRWVDRDETQIRSLVELADELLDALRA